MLWTRVTAPGDAVTVRWVVAADPKLARVVARGEGPTGAARDFTVKVDVAASAPGPPTTTASKRVVRNRRSAAPVHCPARTCPASVSAWRPARTTRSAISTPTPHLPGGRPRRDSPPGRLHLRVRRTTDSATARRIGRIPEPDAEIVTLADYRARHAQYKADPDSQAVHRQHPFIVVWDDHELANNAWSGGAENHNPERGEGDWFVRRNAAVQAFLEWMPIREAASLAPRIHRTLRWGEPRRPRDARHAAGRTRPSGGEPRRCGDDRVAVTRSLLGTAQEAVAVTASSPNRGAPARAGSCSGSR